MTETFPVLPLRDIVVFPHMIVPLFVGREKSVRALEEVMKNDKQIFLVAQKDAAEDDPDTGDIYTIGTVGTVLQLLKLPDGTVKVLVEGTKRAAIARYVDNDDFLEADPEKVPTQVCPPIIAGAIRIALELLEEKGVKHQVLNARYHEQEAKIIANQWQ